MRSLDQMLVGCEVIDHLTGQVLGRVRAVRADPRDPEHWALSIERGSMLASNSLDPLAPPEAEPQSAKDYMVGQVAAVRLTDPDGKPIVEVGGAITPEVLERARHWGLLHRLAATF